jgi:hypothetical protein
MSKRKHGWINWGDHPIVVLISLLASLVTICVPVCTLLKEIPEKKLPARPSFAKPTPILNYEIVIVPLASPTVAPVPEIFDLYFCDRPCNEPNAQLVTHYPEYTTHVYYTFSYRGMTPGLRYTKIWSFDGSQWVYYNCIWQGSEEGAFVSPPLWDTEGLRSGTWVFTLLTRAR